MPGRMTICNMTIEGGGRAGMIAPDDHTVDWVRGRPGAPADFDAAVARWRDLPSDEGAGFDEQVEVDAAAISPMVTWGTNPGMVVEVTDSVPDPAALESERRPRTGRTRAHLHGPQRRHADDRGRPRTGLHRLLHQQPDRGPPRGRRDRRRSPRSPRAFTGDGRPRFPAGQEAAAEAEGLHDVFRGAGFEWREAGCSMCLGMNPDTLAEGERCASTSNRNFEGRQGKGGRTHLGQPEDGRRRGRRGPFRRHQGLELEDEASWT